MDTGLEKLAEASSSVLILKKELAVMEKELADASQRAERVLTGISTLISKLPTELTTNFCSRGHGAGHAGGNCQKPSAESKGEG